MLWNELCNRRQRSAIDCSNDTYDVLALILHILIVLWLWQHTSRTDAHCSRFILDFNSLLQMFVTGALCLNAARFLDTFYLGPARPNGRLFGACSPKT